MSAEEYRDTVPKVLREKSKAEHLFVVRSPQYLDLPLRMSGQPGIYKMPKEIALGARPLLKKTPYAWWPPEEYQSYTVGQFDIYPTSYN